MRTIGEIMLDYVSDIEDTRRHYEQNGTTDPKAVVVFKLIRSGHPVHTMLAKHDHEAKDVVHIFDPDAEGFLEHEGEEPEPYTALPEGTTVVEVLTDFVKLVTLFFPGEPWADQWEQIALEDGWPTKIGGRN